MNAFVNPLPGVPSVESPFFERIFDTGSTDPETLRIARELNARGYAIIDFPEPEFDEVAAAIQAELHPQFDWQGWYETGHQRGHSLRIQDAWTSNENVRRLAANDAVLGLLSRLYGRRAWPFQTLNFPVGTQQHFHTDSIHFSSVPERFMCGVWVALEDVGPDNGPLVYYPGSHRWPIFTNEHLGLCVSEMPARPDQTLYEHFWRELVDVHGAQPEHFIAKKGQALIWAANLLHGGHRQADKMRTRWSQVTHYYFDGCAYYTPMTSDPFYGTIDFRSVANVATGEHVVNRYAGHDISEGFIENTRYSSRRIAGDFDSDAYLHANPDVAAAGVPAEWHYERYGKAEGRRLRR